MARKILLADDSVTAQNMGRKILADAGYEVLTVNNGSAALKKVAEGKPDLIILDVYMPGYSGLEVCQRLKEASETARIPILLTVGKLEPFKPEEARRVRAEGYIVKPFEASELLSALTKLEDKIVPRGEASKPGRFARALAAVEEGRRDPVMSAEEDSSWKERIAFPSGKRKESPAPADVEDSALYNPVNKDLRTTLDASPLAHQQTGDDIRFNLEALAHQGLPKDVTPEEIAALAAAAAQIKGTIAEGPASPAPATPSVAEVHVPQTPAQTAQARTSETQAPETHAPETHTPETHPKAAAEAGRDQQDGAAALASPVPLEVPIPPLSAALAASHTGEKFEATAESGTEERQEAASLTFLGPANGVDAKLAADISRELSPREASSGNGAGRHTVDDEPVTMAAMATEQSAPVASRWMAVPVTLLPEESAISLDQEMQSALTAMQSPVAAASEGQPAAQLASFASAALLAEPPTRAGSISPAERIIHAAVRQFETVGVASPASAQPSLSASAPEPAELVPAELVPVEPVPAERGPVEPVPAQSVPAAAAPIVADPAAIHASPIGDPKADEPAQLAVPQMEPGIEPGMEPVRELETFKEPGPSQPAHEQPTHADAMPAHRVDIPVAAAAERTEHPEITASAVAHEAPESRASAGEPSEIASPTIESALLTEAAAEVKSKDVKEDPAEKESHMAAATAAAWASWRKVRESGDPKGADAPEPSKEADLEPALANASPIEASPKDESKTDEPRTDDFKTDEAAMAVAAGAERAPEAVAVEPESDAGDIANIVDSVLADMRPKIVAEISRKLGKKK